MVAQRQRQPGPVLDPNMTSMMAMNATGGTPPGAPPPNAFDMDPTQLEQMVGQGWKVNDDGSMVPPGAGASMGGPGGYDLDGDGMAQGLAGPQGIGGPPPGPALGPNQGLGTVSTPGTPAGPALPAPSPAPVEPVSPMGGIGGAIAGGLSGLGGGIAGGVRSAAAPPSLTTPVPASAGAPGPALGIGGPGPTTAPLPGPTLGALDEAAPTLNPAAFTSAQNARSMQPAVSAQDPNGYAGADVERSDPRALIPRRRRTSPANGPLSRLRESVGLDSRVTRPQRP